MLFEIFVDVKQHKNTKYIMYSTNPRSVPGQLTTQLFTIEYTQLVKTKKC